MSNSVLAAARRFAPALLLLAPIVAMAARPVDPPSVEWTRGENNVVAATVLSLPDERHVVVRVEDVLAGEAAGELTLRSDKSLSTLVVDHEYLMAFTRLANNDQFRDAKFMDPEGPRLLGLRGLRDVAVVQSTPAARFLFRRARGEDQPTDRERLDAIMNLIAVDDARTHAFALEELYLRDELAAVMTAHDTRALAREALDSRVYPQIRQFAAASTLAVPERGSHPWLLAMDRALLVESPVQLDLVTARPLLVLTAIKGIRQYPRDTDLQLLLPWLESNAPEVVSKALEAADRLDRAATQAHVEALIEEWLMRDDIHADIRRTVEGYFVEAQMERAGQDTAGR